MAYIGGEIGKQDVCSRWLRNQVNPVIHRHKIGVIVLHHTGKPPKGEDKGGNTGHDLSYLGLGSSEITNWARAVSALTQHADDQRLYVLHHAKRGERAGEVRTAFLRHSETGIFWEAAPEPGKSASRGEAKRKASRYDGFGFEYMEPCKAHPDFAKSDLLLFIQKILTEHGEPMDLPKVDTVRRTLQRDGHIQFDRSSGSWKGCYFIPENMRK